jgi:hypothetical protein
MYYGIVGGAEKLFKYFIKNYNPNNIITYSDRRYFNGDIYKKIGFEFIEYTNPNYYYTRDYLFLESRLKYQKHKLKNILENYDDSLTEFENMKNNKYDRIWDCGNSKFIWKNI